MARLRVLDTAIRANTASFEKGMRLANRALKSLSVGMVATAVGTAGFESKMLQAAASVAGAFAIGGPFAAALSAVGIIIGGLIGKASAMDREWTKHMESMQGKVESLRAAAQKARDELFTAMGGDLDVRALDSIHAQIDALSQLREKHEEFLKTRGLEVRDPVTGFWSFLESPRVNEARKRIQELDKDIEKLTDQAVEIRIKIEAVGDLDRLRQLEERLSARDKEIGEGNKRVRELFEDKMAPAVEFGSAMSANLTSGIADAVTNGFNTASLEGLKRRLFGTIADALAKAFIAKPAEAFFSNIAAAFVSSPSNSEIARARAG